MADNIYSYIKSQEANFGRDIDIQGWSWNFPRHVKQSFYYNHGRLMEGNPTDVPVKNITRPILNLQKRAEDIDAKDVLLYVDDPVSHHLSFLVKKYHDDVFVIENDLDSFFDELNESKIDYGGGLCKKMKGARPQVIDLRSLAFCDQTNMLAGSLGIKHAYSPEELKDMETRGWGKTENGATITIDELIKLAEPKKTIDPLSNIEIPTTGWNVEIYEVHGMLPTSFLSENDQATISKKYSYQIHIVGFYKSKETGKENLKTGVSLFRKTQKERNIKQVLRDKIYSRALGFGGAEELFESQAWTTHGVIRKKELLDAVSKIILKTTDPSIAQRHPSGLKNLDNLEILSVAEGSDIGQVDTNPRSFQLFTQDMNEWEEHAKEIGGATEALLGTNPPAGTPFKLQDLITTQGKGLHDRRRGKFAKFIEEVYRDWIIPYIIQEITKGVRFLSELSADDMQYVSDCLIRNKGNEYKKRKILAGGVVEEGEVEAYTEIVREEFQRGGNKKFIEVLKGEFDKQPLRVKINVAGKQRDLARMTDSLVNIFQQIIASPEGFQQMMQNPALARTFSRILEYSGLSASDFGGFQYQQKAIPSPMASEMTAGKALAVR